TGSTARLAGIAGGHTGGIIGIAQHISPAMVSGIGKLGFCLLQKLHSLLATSTRPRQRDKAAFFDFQLKSCAALRLPITHIKTLTAPLACAQQMPASAYRHQPFPARRPSAYPAPVWLHATPACAAIAQCNARWPRLRQSGCSLE